MSAAPISTGGGGSEGAAGAAALTMPAVKLELVKAAALQPALSSGSTAPSPVAVTLSNNAIQNRLGLRISYVSCLLGPAALGLRASGLPAGVGIPIRSEPGDAHARLLTGKSVQSGPVLNNRGSSWFCSISRWLRAHGAAEADKVVVTPIPARGGDPDVGGSGLVAVMVRLERTAAGSATRPLGEGASGVCHGGAAGDNDVAGGVSGEEKEGGPSHGAQPRQRFQRALPLPDALAAALGPRQGAVVLAATFAASSLYISKPAMLRLLGPDHGHMLAQGLPPGMRLPVRDGIATRGPHRRCWLS